MRGNRLCLCELLIRESVQARRITLCSCAGKRSPGGWRGERGVSPTRSSGEPSVSAHHACSGLQAQTLTGPALPVAGQVSLCGRSCAAVQEMTLLEGVWEGEGGWREGEEWGECGRGRGLEGGVGVGRVWEREGEEGGVGRVWEGEGAGGRGRGGESVGEGGGRGRESVGGGGGWREG